MPLLHLIEQYNGWLFGLLFSSLILWEALAPARPPAESLLKRWLINAALFCSGRAAFLLLSSASLLTAAAVASVYGSGPLSYQGIPFWLRLLLGVFAFDLLAYARHWLFHASDWLWRIHRAHHSDEGYDVTTGLRFHPVETFAVLASNLSLVYLLTPPPASVILFELLAVVANLVAHGNIRLPGEQWIRWAFITPEVHHIHHSDHPLDQRSNYGTVFPFWDRLFRTFTPVGR